MASVLAIVSKAIFAKEARGLGLGDVFSTELYRSKNRGLAPLAEGGKLYLATVRPGDELWLVAVLEAPTQSDEGWAAAANTRPIVDISALIPKLVFTSGKGITAAAGKLGMSLQTPRCLTDADVALLDGALGAPAAPRATSRQAAAPKASKAKASKAKAPKAKASKAKASKPPAKSPAKPTADASDEAATFRRLLSLWRSSKDPALAETIDAFARAHESDEAKTLRRRKKVPHDEWLVLARKAPSLDRGAVLATFADAPATQVKARAEVLATWPTDPRIVDSLHELVVKLPWISSGSRPVWTRVFGMLRAHADPRSRAVAKDFDPSGIRSSWEGPAQWMGDHLRRVVAALDKAEEPRPLSDADRAELDGVTANLAKLASGGSGRSADEQLAYVLDHPDDDEARLILADVLQELGDPRGELIALQFAAEEAPLNREQRRREKELLGELEEELLGPWAPIVMKRGLRFDKGFVYSCELKENAHDRQIAAALESRVGATLRHLAAPIHVLLDPSLSQLQEVEVQAMWGKETELTRLFRADRPLPFEALELWLHEGEPELLDGCDCLPQLQRLTLHGRQREILDGACRELSRNTPELCVVGLQPHVFGAEVATWLAPERRTRRAVLSAEESGYWQGTIAVGSAAGGYVVEVELSTPSATLQGCVARCFDFLRLTLNALRPLGLARVEVRLLKTIRDKAMRTRLEQTLAGSTAEGTTVLFLEG